MKTFIIAEVGVNHNGDLAMARELIDVAAGLGADAVKFQTFDAAKLVRPEAEKAEYQRRQTGDGDQKAMLAALQLSEADHAPLVRHCADRGIEFMSTPFDTDAVGFLSSIGVRRLKLPSGDITNIPLIRRFAAAGLPVIMSTGMAFMAEVAAAKRAIEAEWDRLGLMQDRADRLIVLHCTSNYPAEPEDVNLTAMTAMAAELGAPVGYSDHSAGTEIAVAAVALGAVVIEKHITLDRTLPGPDHAASLEPAAFAEMVRQIRRVELARGDGIKAPRPAELPVRAVVRRSITMRHAVAAGALLTLEDLIMLRPANGIAADRIDDVVGRIAAHALPADHLLDWADLV